MSEKTRAIDAERKRRARKQQRVINDRKQSINKAMQISAARKGGAGKGGGAAGKGK